MDLHKYRAPLKTYSKRVLQDSYKPPEKRQRIDSRKPLQELTERKILSSTPSSKKKRSIVDYFGTSTHSSSFFIPTSSKPSPILPKREADTPLSSPPLPNSSPSIELGKKRRRRKLTTRPALKLIEMASSEVPAATGGVVSENNAGPVSNESASSTSNSVSAFGGAPAAFSNADVGASSSSGPVAHTTNPPNTTTGFQYNVPTAATFTFNVPGFSLTLPMSGVPVTSSMVQTQIDLGIATRVTCAECRFMYNRTDVQDNLHHHRFHDAFVFGVPIGNLQSTQSQNVRHFAMPIEAGRDYAVMVDLTSSPGWKNLVVNVLNANVDRDIGALATNSNNLWSTMPDPEITTADNGRDRNQIPQFKVYLYVKDFGPTGPKRVLSLLLAERVTKALGTYKAQLQEDDFGPFPSIVPVTSLEVSEWEVEVVMGINKLWTHKDHRHKGFARRLFQIARETFIWGHRIPRDRVAWTQTTEAGAKFAERSFIQNDPDFVFLTYTEEA